MQKESIILVGGGGHCVSCIDVIESLGKYNIVGVLDRPEKQGRNILGYPVIGSDDALPSLLENCKNYCITVGQIQSPEIRRNIYDKIKAAGGSLPYIVSPFAHVSEHASIGEGTIIMHHALVNADAVVGECCIINSKALIEHEVKIGEFCHISTASCINGQVTIGAGCFIGSNTVVNNNLTISSNIVVAAGSHVFKNIREAGVSIGNKMEKHQ